MRRPDWLLLVMLPAFIAAGYCKRLALIFLPALPRPLLSPHCRTQCMPWAKSCISYFGANRREVRGKYLKNAKAGFLARISLLACSLIVWCFSLLFSCWCWYSLLLREARSCGLIASVFSCFICLSVAVSSERTKKIFQGKHTQHKIFSVLILTEILNKSRTITVHAKRQKQQTRTQRKHSALFSRERQIGCTIRKEYHYSLAGE